MRTAVRMSETQFQAALVQAARLAGYRVYHTFDSRRSESGWPDLTMVRGPRLIFAELKSATGKVTRAQQDWLMALTAAGGECYVWFPKDYDDALRILTARPRLSAAPRIVRTTA